MGEGAERLQNERRKAWTEQQSVFIYRLAVTLVGLILRFWVRRFRAVGVENVPATGGAFLIANHTSAMDPFILGYPVKQRMLRGPGKVELFENRFFAYLMRRLGIFPLRQDIADAAAVRTMVALYRRGDMVIVYPEGGRSPTGELQPFLPAFTRLVIKLQAPLVPAGIAGGRELLPIGARIPRYNSPVAVVYGRPFDLSAYYGRNPSPDTVERATAELQNRIAELVERACAERTGLLEG